MIENDIFCYRYIDESTSHPKQLEDDLEASFRSFRLNWEKTKYNYEDCCCPLRIVPLNKKQKNENGCKVTLDNYVPLNDEPDLVVTETQEFPFLIAPLKDYADDIRRFIHSCLREKFYVIFDIYIVDICNMPKIKTKLELIANAPLTRNHSFFIVTINEESEEEIEKTVAVLDTFTSKHKHIYYEKLKLKGNENHLNNVVENVIIKVRNVLIGIGEANLKRIETLFEDYKTHNTAGFSSRFNFFRMASYTDPAMKKLKNKEMLSKILQLNLYFYHIGKYSIFYHYNKLIIKECFKRRHLLALLTCLYTQLNLLKESYFHTCIERANTSAVKVDTDNNDDDYNDNIEAGERIENVEEFKKFYCDEFIRFAFQFNQKLQENEFEFGNDELSEALEAVGLNGSLNNEYKQIYYIFTYIKLACLDFAFLIKHKHFYRDIFSMALLYIDKQEYDLKLLVLKQVVYFLYYSRRILKGHLVRKALYYDMTLIKISVKSPDFCNKLLEEVTSNKYYSNIADLINEILFLKIKKCLKDGNEEGCFNTYYSIINHYNKITSKTPQHYLEIANNKCGKFYMAKVLKLLQKTRKFCLNPAFLSIDPERSRIKMQHQFFKDPAEQKVSGNCVEYYEDSSVALEIQLNNNLIFDLEVNSIELVLYNKTKQTFQYVSPDNISTKNILIGPISSLPLLFSFGLNNSEIILCYIKINTNRFIDEIPLCYDLNKNFRFVNNKNNVQSTDRFHTVDEGYENSSKQDDNCVCFKPTKQPISITEESPDKDIVTTVGSFVVLVYNMSTVNNDTIVLKNIKSYNYKIWNHLLTALNDNTKKLTLLVYLDRNCILKTLQISLKAVVAGKEHNLFISKPIKCTVDENCDIRRLEKKHLFFHISPRQDYSNFDNSFLIDHKNKVIYFQNNDTAANEIHKQNNIVEYNRLKDEISEIPQFVRENGANLDKLLVQVIKGVEQSLYNMIYLSEKLKIGKYDVSSIVSIDESTGQSKIHRGLAENEFTALLSDEHNELHEKEIMEKMFTFTVSANKLERSLYNVSFYCKSTLMGSSFVKINTKDKVNHYEWIDDGLSNVEIELTPENNEMILHKRVNIEDSPKADSYEVLFIVKGKYKDLVFKKTSKSIIFK
eukprot:GAHX01000438.1.p1 GENE.GAHX01000438.1~~GAHX01000438.1.p1  ORF type:complete len:1123 (-),score=219.84 GAHX01000438.1:1795-5163(-)